MKEYHHSPIERMCKTKAEDGISEMEFFKLTELVLYVRERSLDVNVNMKLGKNTILEVDYIIFKDFIIISIFQEKNILIKI